MKIKQISLRGYKSFGNNKQTLELYERGGLILLNGSNGEGKTSLIESVEYTLYGKVKLNRSKKKWATLSSLPNRINNELLTEVIFESNNKNIEVKRGISPDILELRENDILNKNQKSNINDIIETYVGMDIDTFKSFISISINDFKNFIQLNADDKRGLLDKMFNLEIINILSDILKTLAKSNRESIIKLDSEILTISESILTIQKSVDKYKNDDLNNKENTINSLKKEMSDKKETFISLKEKLSTINKKEIELENLISQEKEQYVITNSDIKKIDSEIDLYNSGKCPTCKTDFNDRHFIDIKQVLLDKSTSYKKILSEIRTKIEDLQNKKIKLNDIKKNTEVLFNDLSFLLKTNKNKIDELNKDESNVDFKHLYELIDTHKDKKEKSDNILNLKKDKEITYKKLNTVLTDGELRRNIIKNIISPINSYIDANIKLIGLPFSVKLDDDFNANIKSMGVEVEHESLSNGENRLVNIVVLISYLMYIRKNKNINILFMDEVFESIDIDNIDYVLKMLRKFAIDYSINIFVVHHSIMKSDNFDRIIRIKKSIFSHIIE